MALYANISLMASWHFLPLTATEWNGCIMMSKCSRILMATCITVNLKFSQFVIVIDPQRVLVKIVGIERIVRNIGAAAHMLHKLWWSLSFMTRNWRRWISSFRWSERWVFQQMHQGRKKGEVRGRNRWADDVFALHFVASAKNRQVGGAYGIVSTMFFALYILLWNLEYATLGSFQWVESPATPSGSTRVQRNRK